MYSEETHHRQPLPPHVLGEHPPQPCADAALCDPGLQAALLDGRIRVDPEVADQPGKSSPAQSQGDRDHWCLPSHLTPITGDEFKLDHIIGSALTCSRPTTMATKEELVNSFKKEKVTAELALKDEYVEVVLK